MRRLPRVFFWVPCVLALAGCASGGSAGSGANPSESYTRDFGRLLVPTLDEARLKVWAKHNWHVRREQVEYQNIYWESDWRPFNVPESMAITGPTEARGRIIIRGRRVADELDGRGLYRVTFVGEYQVRGGSSEQWRPGDIPEDAEDVFAQVAGDLALEVRTGVRR